MEPKPRLRPTACVGGFQTPRLAPHPIGLLPQGFTGRSRWLQLADLLLQLGLAPAQPHPSPGRPNLCRPRQPRHHGSAVSALESHDRPGPPTEPAAARADQASSRQASQGLSRSNDQLLQAQDSSRCRHHSRRPGSGHRSAPNGNPTAGSSSLQRWSQLRLGQYPQGWRLTIQP